eukprot:419962_1
MARGDLNRIRKELVELSRDKQSSVTCTALQDDLSHLLGVIEGPQGTPFEGGTFKIDVTIPTQYPYQPPKMKFMTKIWHPNISSQTGAICLDILKDQWSPALTIKTTLLSLQALMCSPEPDDPQDAEVARMYKDSQSTYIQTATFWTETYAKEKSAGDEEEILRRICEMGFDEASARKALQDNNWQEQEAIDKLLSGC